ncbi:MAG: hypothetical protein H7274_08245, partial [Rhodoferax sp.]|nr:hypothetical protein [Rhodoferax sp.]
MRLSPEQGTAIRASVSRLAGATARVWLFGSRVNDDSRGGAVDLLAGVDGIVEEPAQRFARRAARVSKSMCERKVDVLIQASNLLHVPVDTAALAQGVVCETGRIGVSGIICLNLSSEFFVILE